MKTKTKYPIVTSCPNCQAFVDGRVLYDVLFQIGKDHELDPMRITRALSAVTGLWTAACAKQAKIKGVPLTAAQIDELVQDVLGDTDYALRTYVFDAPAQHKH